MNDELTLVIMAAGMGSRFGGLKQIEPVGPNGEFIIDYSIYDAIKAGFKKVVFVIKKENYDLFRETIGSRIESKIKVEYAFQENFIDYDGKHFEREKPYGTSYAIYAAKNFVDGNFVVINSDDFYGRSAYFTAYDFLKNNSDSKCLGMVSYKASNTMTENGSVKRGVCFIENGFLKNIVESKLEYINNKIIASPLNGDESFEIDNDQEVSMNVLLFTPYIFELIEKYQSDFIKELERDSSSEYLIPDVIKKSINDNYAYVKMLNTDSVWHGVTYKEDKELLVNSINELINNGEYQSNLWKI